MRRGWCTTQKASVNASMSGSHGLRPSGSMLKASASSNVMTMKSGLAGRRSWSPRGMMLMTRTPASAA
jgi:hypothetical protein